MLDKWETEMTDRAQELLGSMMIFEITDYLKEKVVEINEAVLDKYEKIEEAQKVENTLKSTVTGDIK